MHTSDESGSASAEDSSVEDEVKYQFLTVKAIRGREAGARTKHESEGWEFVSQTPGTLRSELTFRKPKPKALGAYVAQGYAAFRRLEPTTQKRVLVGVGGVVGLLVLWGTVSAAFGGDDEAPVASESAPAQTEKPEETTEPTEEPVEEPTEEPEATQEPSEEPEASETPAVEPYSYEGPEYEVVVVDDKVGPAKLSQFWALASPEFNFSKDGYKEQVRLIIEDVAREQGTANFMMQVVTNREIAEAEALSTQQAFVAEYGDAYFINTIPKLEVKGWVASYTGGFDYNTGKASDAPEAFEVIWRPYATSEIENRQPVVNTSPDTEVETEDETEASASPTPKPTPKPNALEERTAINFLAKAWEARFPFGGDVNDLLGLLDVVKNRDGSYYIEVTATVENEFGNEFDTVVRGTVAGTNTSPTIRQSTIDNPGGGTIGYYE